MFCSTGLDRTIVSLNSRAGKPLKTEDREVSVEQLVVSDYIASTFAERGVRLVARPAAVPPPQAELLVCAAPTAASRAIVRPSDQ